MDGNQVDKEGLFDLKESLKINRSLKILSLNSCAIGTELMCIVVDSLLETQTLRKLYLANNDIQVRPSPPH